MSTTLQAPNGMSGIVQHEGQTYHVTSDGSIVVPANAVSSLLDAGFTFPVVPLLNAKTVLSAEAVINGFSDPVELVPAPGVGKVLVPLFAMASLNFNTRRFYKNAAHTGFLAYGSGGSILGVQSNCGGIVTEVDDYMNLDTGLAMYGLRSDQENEPINYIGSFPGGKVTAFAINHPGTGYEVGDEVFTVTMNTMPWTVTSVDGDGAVTGITNDDSYGELLGNNIATVTQGSGTGLTLDITAVNPGDGTLDLTIIYAVATL